MHKVFKVTYFSPLNSVKTEENKTKHICKNHICRELMFLLLHSINLQDAGCISQLIMVNNGKSN